MLGDELRLAISSDIFWYTKTLSRGFFSFDIMLNWVQGNLGIPYIYWPSVLSGYLGNLSNLRKEIEERVFH